MGVATEVVVASGMFVLGLLLWTWLEYVLHRFAGHSSKLGKPIRREHLAHHAKPDHFTSFARKLVLAVPVLGGLGLVTVPWLGGAGVALVFGVLVGWTFYERLHRATHVRGPRNRYGAWARQHHLHHHFMSPHTNHGVTSPLWDWVFGTLAASEPVRVPRRQIHCFAWLVDEQDALKAEYSGAYRVV